MSDPGWPQSEGSDDWVEIPPQSPHQVAVEQQDSSPRYGRIGRTSKRRTPELHIPEDSAELEPLRQLLLESNYSYEGIYETLGVPEGEPFKVGEAQQYLRRLSSGSPLSVLIKLFIIGLGVRLEEAQSALTEPIVQSLLRVGLIERSRSRLSSSKRIQPFEGFFFVVDPPLIRNQPDDVLGVGPSGRLISSLTIRRPIEKALDLGCGCGLQAMLASRHVQQVLAVDLNPRAVLFTQFNLRLNGIENVQVHQGDLFEPAAGQRFDLIVCNPPYVISPERDLLYRDSGIPINGLVRRILSELPDHLQEGGFGLVGCHWAHREKDEWWRPVYPWVATRSCDVWLTHFSTEEPLNYSLRWNQGLQEEGQRRYKRTVRRWIRWYRHQGITRITAAAVTFRRRAAERTWMRAATASAPTGENAGEQLQRIFAAHDHLAQLSGADELLHERFRLAAGCQLQLTLCADNDGLQAESAELSSGNGLGVVLRMTGEAGEWIGQLGNGRTLQQAIETWAEVHGDRAQASTSWQLALVQKLFGFGMLLRAGSSDEPG